MANELVIPEQREIQSITDFSAIKNLQDTAAILRQFDLTRKERNILFEKEGFLAVRAGELYDGLEDERRDVRSLPRETTAKQRAEEEIGKGRKTLSQWVRMANVKDVYQKIVEYCRSQTEQKEETTFKGLWNYLFGKAHVSYNTGEEEWYTPPKYIEAARKTMGDIDLDPASTGDANMIIRARKYYSVQDDGLKQNWEGKVWMNPPYSTELIGKFIFKLLESLKTESVTEAIVLVNNATETKWFQPMIDLAKVICFPAGRVHFWNPGKETASPLQGQAVLYFGDNKDDFVENFSMFGGISFGKTWCNRK